MQCPYTGHQFSTEHPFNFGDIPVKQKLMWALGIAAVVVVVVAVLKSGKLGNVPVVGKFLTI